MALAAAASALLAGAPSAQAVDRYSLANGCFSLRSQSLGRVVAGPFRMQATELGMYLFYAKDRTFLAANGDAVEQAAAPSADADWTVDETTGGFTVKLGDRALTVAGGKLAMGA